MKRNSYFFCIFWLALYKKLARINLILCSLFSVSNCVYITDVQNMRLQNFRKRYIPWYYLHQASPRKNQRNYKEHCQQGESPSSKDSLKPALETKPPTKMFHQHLQRK